MAFRNVMQRQRSENENDWRKKSRSEKHVKRQRRNGNDKKLSAGSVQNGRRRSAERKQPPRLLKQNANAGRKNASERRGRKKNDNVSWSGSRLLHGNQESMCGFYSSY